MLHTAWCCLMGSIMQIWPLQELRLQRQAKPDSNSALLFWLASKQQSKQQHIREGDRQQSGVWQLREAMREAVGGRKGMCSCTFCDKRLTLQLSLRSGLRAHTQTVADPPGKAEIPILMSTSARKPPSSCTRANGDNIYLARGQRQGENLSLCS